MEIKLTIQGGKRTHNILKTVAKVQNADATDVTYDFLKLEIIAKIKRSNSHISKRVGNLLFFFFFPFLFYYFFINSPRKLQRTPSKGKKLLEKYQRARDK